MVSSRAAQRRATHDTVVAAAHREFLVTGVAGARVLDICRAAGVSESTFFRHATSKADLATARLQERLEALLADVGHRVAQHLAAHPGQTLSAGTVARAIAQVLGAHGTALTPAERLELRLLRAEADPGPQLTVLHQRLAERLPAVLGDHLPAGGPAALDLAMLTHEVVGAALGAATHWAAGGAGDPVAAVRQRLLTLSGELAGIGGTGDADPSSNDPAPRSNDPAPRSSDPAPTSSDPAPPSRDGAGRVAGAATTPPPGDAPVTPAAAPAPATETRQQRRRRIADAALDLFIERGYDRTTLTDVAARVGCSLRTVFNTVSSREEAVFPLGVPDVIGALRASVLALGPAAGADHGRGATEGPDDPLRTAVTLIDGWGRVLQRLDGRREWDRYRLIEATPALRARQAARMAEFVEGGARLVAERTGMELHEARLLVALFFAAMRSAQHRWTAQPYGPFGPVLADELHRLHSLADMLPMPGGFADRMAARRAD